MKFRIGIDVGGTFTDFLLIDETGHSQVYKTLTTPKDPTIGFFNGLKDMATDLKISLGQFIDSVELIVHGTTVGTNAALTNNGAKTALLTTKGFRDILQMRRGIKPDGYNNKYTPPEAPVQRRHRLGIEERIDLNGKEITPLNKEELQDALEKIMKDDIESIAICFMHSYANDSHEQEVKRMIESKYPDKYITISSELVPRARLYERTSTTTLNSYVGPIIRNYFQKLLNKLSEHEFKGTLLIMQSNGGVATPTSTIEKAANTLLSGPASAPIAGSLYLKNHDIKDAITMDMGGTSFDVALVKDGVPLTRTEGEIANWPVSLPTVDIHTIGSGGGSIAWVDEGGLLHVGPQSAGASPGPACYGFGGQYPTVTDANLILGYLNPDFFLGGKMSLDYDQAYRAIKEHVADRLGLSVEGAAKGIIDLVNVSMANGIKEITVKRGYDPREFPLVCAGGAGPLHAALIANELNCDLIIVPRESSIFCAAGMLMSDLRHDFVKAYRSIIGDISPETMEQKFSELMELGYQTLKSEGVADEEIQYRYSLDIRYAGQYYEVNVPLEEEQVSQQKLAEIEEKFHQMHDQLFGYSTPGVPVEVINFNISAIGVTRKPTMKDSLYNGASSEHALKGYRLAGLGEKGKHIEIPVYDGDQISHGNRIKGPAIVEQVVTTIIVPYGFDVICDKINNFVLYNRKLDEKDVNVFIDTQGGAIVNG